MKKRELQLKKNIGWFGVIRKIYRAYYSPNRRWWLPITVWLPIVYFIAPDFLPGWIDDTIFLFLCGVLALLGSEEALQEDFTEHEIQKIFTPIK